MTQKHCTRSAAGSAKSVTALMFTLVLKSLPPTFAASFSPPVDSFDPSPNAFLVASAIQTNGQVVLGGAFTSIGIFPRTRLGRVWPDGSVDTNFNVPASATVYCLAIVPDGKILVGGDFTSLGTQTRYALGRLNTDGSVDTGFRATIFESMSTPRVQSIVVQPDGKILAGGKTLDQFAATAGFLYRFGTNAVTDAAFPRLAMRNGSVESIALQSDGKILVGGRFSLIGSTFAYRLARLDTNGTLDVTFSPQIDTSPGAAVTCLAVQPDSKILVGGIFISAGGAARTNIARLNPDGSADLNFHPQTAGGGPSVVYSIALQADGKLVMSGSFNTLAGASRANIGRVNPDGSIDTSFDPSASSTVQGVALQPDGKILTVGSMTSVSAQPRQNLARLASPDAGVQSLRYDGTNIAWLRIGSCSELWNVSFDYCTNSVDWLALGSGTRTVDGWTLAAPALPAAATLRARGVATGGGYNGSSWIVQEFWPGARPTFFSTDAAFGFSTNLFGFNFKSGYGDTIVVEGSIDMHTWTPLRTNVVFSDSVYFNDIDSSTFLARYYRLRLY